MKIEDKIRSYLINATSIPEAAFIYENEVFKFPDSLDYIVKEWRIFMNAGRLTDATKTRQFMIEYDVMQREKAQEDFISGPAEELMDALQDYTDEEVWNVEVTTGQTQKGLVAIIATVNLIKE